MGDTVRVLPASLEGDHRHPFIVWVVAGRSLGPETTASGTTYFHYVGSAPRRESGSPGGTIATYTHDDVVNWSQPSRVLGSQFNETHRTLSPLPDI